MLDVMNALVSTIRDAGTLSYLQWVGIIDSELAPPPEPQFPFVGIVDGGLIAESRPSHKDLETFTVKIVAYQSLLAPEPGEHLTGQVSLPEGQGTGLLQITEDLKTLLQDNFLGIPNIHWAHRDRVVPSELLLDEPAARFVMMQQSIYTYRRIV